MARLTIGITGGIGSGKSYVCSMLRQYGIPVYDCDAEAKRLMAESEEIRSQLDTLLDGEAYSYNADAQKYELNKAAIANFLFASKQNASIINSIVHPVVKQDFCSWAEQQTADIAAQECAILFESGFADTVDKTVEVYAPLETRLQRAMKRDNASAQQIEARMAQQMPEEEKRSIADYCIINDGAANLTEQIESIISELGGQLTKEK